MVIFEPGFGTGRVNCDSVRLYRALSYCGVRHPGGIGVRTQLTVSHTDLAEVS